VNPYLQKRLMALSGIFWLVYLILHMLVNLNFLTGKDNFNGFYQWFNEAIILRWSLIIVLVLSILFHIYIAISRQFNSNAKRHIAYKKPYPKAIPRFIAWSGASLLFSFIVFHFVQMQLLASRDFYQEMVTIFTDPIMLLVYALGFVALAAHLHHSLSNVGQTFGLTHKQHQKPVIAFLLFLIGGFILIPMSLYVG
jgi:succinate dehydrogenase / fumarate reductase cytochrome b subunit